MPKYTDLVIIVMTTRRQTDKAYYFIQFTPYACAWVIMYFIVTVMHKHASEWGYYNFVEMVLLSKGAGKSF